MSDTISLKGKSKPHVLAALYNASRPQGMGFMNYDATPMTAEQAEELLKSQTDFDYLRGRVMKVDLKGDELNTWGYDRDNGRGAAERAINAIVYRTAADGVNSAYIQKAHEAGKADAAADVREHLGDQTTKRGGIFTLGLDDVADVLAPAIDRATAK